jgi:quercetin dioxygenase-like cupin family protein
MKLTALHPDDKPVSTKVLYTGEGAVIALSIKANQTLKEHMTKVPATLICVSGMGTYNEANESIEMSSGCVVQIAPEVMHSVTAITDCQFLLIKQG